MRHVSSVITVVKNHYSVIDFAYEEEEEEEERASERAYAKHFASVRALENCLIYELTGTNCNIYYINRIHTGYEIRHLRSVGNVTKPQNVSRRLLYILYKTVI